MTRFIRVQADGQYASYTVPTEEEYNDYREKVNQCFERLNAKVEALEKERPKKEEPFTDGKIILTLMNGKGDMLELEGTEKHFVDFEAERKERNDALFPSGMSLIDTISLALEHGLSVRKLTPNKK